MTPERTIDGATWIRSLGPARKRRAGTSQRTRDAIRLYSTEPLAHIRLIGSQPKDADVNGRTN